MISPHELNQIDAAQQEFPDLELPNLFPSMQHHGLHPAFSRSSSSIKSNSEPECDVQMCLDAESPMPGDEICDEALEIIREWELHMSTASDGTGGPQFLVAESLEAVDYSLPPRRYWRTSWIYMTRRLSESAALKMESGTHA